ncbi:MAG: hypothetical protein JWL58_356 [Streptosporangiaceae bacterium]|jgi:hypothetical protein|nr:hypothetical protein [Streptosporangiaceae bacterium]
MRASPSSGMPSLQPSVKPIATAVAFVVPAGRLRSRQHVAHLDLRR